MWKCDDCERTFDGPAVIENKEQYEFWGANFTHSTYDPKCPYCESEEVEECSICNQCSDPKPSDGEDYCEECRVEVTSEISAVLTGLLEKYDEDLVKQALVKWVEDYKEESV